MDENKIIDILFDSIIREPEWELDNDFHQYYHAINVLVMGFNTNHQYFYLILH